MSQSATSVSTTGDAAALAERVDRLMATTWRESKATYFPQAEKTAVVVARRILRDIRRRGLDVGTSLPPEAEMAGDLRVSRGSLREALRLLEFQGLITIKPGPGGGPILGEPTNQDFGRVVSLHLNSRGISVGELAETRLILDPMLAAMAAENRTANSVDVLWEVIEMIKAIPIGRNSDYPRMGTVFNSMIGAMSGNAVLALMSGGIRALWMERLTTLDYTPAFRQRTIKHFQLVAQAVTDQDPEAAEEAMRALIQTRLREVARSQPDLLGEIVDWR